MLQAIIDNKNKIKNKKLVVDSKRKQEATLHLGFVMRNVVNVAFLKNEKEKRAIHKKIHNIFSQ